MLVLGAGTVERNQKVNLSRGNRAEGRPWGDRGQESWSLDGRGEELGVSRCTAASRPCQGCVKGPHP